MKKILSIVLSLVFCLTLMPLGEIKMAKAAFTTTPMIAAGGNHTIVLKSDGTVWAWGNNEFGQLGDGTTTVQYTPVQVQNLNRVIAIAAGEFHTVALKSDGTVWAWGNNDKGQLGDGTTISRYSPVQVKNLAGITAIAVGGSYIWETISGEMLLQQAGISVALKSDGTVWAWGDNYYGQLGDGTTTDRATPVQVENLSGVTAIAAGNSHAIALKSDGTVWTWGWKYYGQLGDGIGGGEWDDYSNTPVQVQNPSDVTAIATGGDHAIALKSDGTVWTWGSNFWGQIGDGTTTSRYTPVLVMSLSDVTAITAGGNRSIALKPDGTVWAWGLTYRYQLSVGTSFDPTPKDVVYGMTAVAAGGSHTVTLKSDGSVWAWGANNSGQLGDGTTTSRYLSYSNTGIPWYQLPIQVLGETGVGYFNVYESSSGEHHSVSISTMLNGSVASNCSSARAGSMVSLTITPSEGYKLKEGALKYNDSLVKGTAFVMPDCDVVVTAEFEPVSSDAEPEPIVFGKKVDLKYPMNLYIFPDKNVPPVPLGSNAQYAEELKYWAAELGHDFSRLDYSKAIATPFKMPYLTTANEVVFDKNSTMTVKDVMADIIMLGHMQQYIIDEENSLKNYAGKTDTTAKINESTKKMLKYLGRYNDYVGAQPAKFSDPRTKTKALAAIEAIINATWDQKLSGAKLLDKFQEKVIEPNPQLGSIMRELEEASTNDALYRAQNNFLNTISLGTNIYRSIAGEPKYIYDSVGKIVDAMGNDTLSGVKKYTDGVKGVYDFIKLIDTSFGPVTASAKIATAYLKFCAKMYSWVKDQYPSWLFYSNYYLPRTEPAYFNRIGFDQSGGIPLFLTSFSDQELNSCDELSRFLLSALNKHNNLNSVYYVQDTFSSADKRSLVIAAATLSDIRLTNYRELQKYLLDYIEAQCLPTGKAKTAKVSCPVLVTIVDQEGNVLFTLNTDESYSQNYNQYCTFYLAGDNRDEKIFIIQDDYDFIITPYEDGLMSCSFQTIDENGHTKEYSYSDISIDTSSEFMFTTTLGNVPKLEKVSGGASEEISATEEVILASQVIIDADSVELYCGGTRQLNADVSPSATTDKAITWHSSDPAIVAVNDAGLVTAISIGNAMIIAQSNTENVYSMCEVTVLPRSTDMTTVAFQATKGGTISAEMADKYLIGSTIAIYATPDEDYVFAGWAATNGGEFADNSSDYTFFTVPSAPTTITASFTSCKRGDANCDGKVDASDAAAILRHLVQLTRLTPRGLENAKVTAGTGPVSAADAAKILRWLVQLEKDL